MMRLTGGFSLCERLTSSGLQILCYHGISRLDEHLAAPQLFMSKELFSARMAWLKRKGYRVLALEDALERLDCGDLPSRAIVITFDDGWYGCLEGGFDELVSLGYPATMYVTTYYVQKQFPIFNVAVPYLLWRGRQLTLDLRELNDALVGRANLTNLKQRAIAAGQITNFGCSFLGSQDRTDLLYRLAEQVGVDPVNLFERQRVYTLMNREELMEAAAMGIDIQLHTHRHRFPLDDENALRREIADNRKVLLASGKIETHHLCYPGGFYDSKVFAVLRSEGIKTATTTEAGLNYQGGERLALGRFLDGENISPIEFHGEMAGVGEVIRRLRAGCPPWLNTRHFQQ